VDNVKLYFQMLLEVYRYSALLPLNLPHCTMEDTTLRGFFIPKGTTIFSNLYAHHRNPEFFPEPEAFKPERFLTTEGILGMSLPYLFR
jgi:cytochrome P450